MIWSIHCCSYTIIAGIGKDMDNWLEGELDEALISLLEKGLIEVEYNEQLEARFRATDEGKKYIESVLGDDFF
jgi:DNA-binding PadR family transcriptional regulator